MSDVWSEETLRVEAESDGLDTHDLELFSRWLSRGDGVAVYENHDLGHPEVGHRQWMSYGGTAAQLEVDTPPTTLPDIGGRIHWRYQLIATCRREVK